MRGVGFEHMPQGTVVFDPQVVIQPDDSDGYDTFIYNHNYYPNESNYNYGAYTLLQI
ncbi:MAG: hypothetical protein GWN00_35640, partial [Aliifodinibius sp.]|nr:hypothetical protein [Fodinibius sp.]NIY29931.1 hypothetical protein [Fodinibius sp.]